MHHLIRNGTQGAALDLLTALLLSFVIQAHGNTDKAVSILKADNGGWGIGHFFKLLSDSVAVLTVVTINSVKDKEWLKALEVVYIWCEPESVTQPGNASAGGFVTLAR